MFKSTYKIKAQILSIHCIPVTFVANFFGIFVVLLWNKKKGKANLLEKITINFIAYFMRQIEK